MCQVQQEGDGKFGDVYKCGKWVHGRCMKMKTVTSTLAKGFVCEHVLIQRKELWNEVKNYHFLTRLTL